MFCPACYGDNVKISPRRDGVERPGFLTGTEHGASPQAWPRGLLSLSSPLALSVLGLSGIAGWVLWISILRREPGQDWMVFYTAAKAFLVGDLSLIYDGERLTETINLGFGDWLSSPLNFHPWLYPPHFLLLLIPFAALPFGASYLLYVGLTFLAFVVAICRRTGQGLRVAGALLLFPQAPFTFLTGQNSFMTGAILVGGFGLLRRRPLLGGAILGLGTCKPQMFLMVPVALLASRQWKAIAGAGATAGALIVTSLLVLGPGVWADWLRVMFAPGETYHAWLTAGRLLGQSVFACAVLLGVPAGAADVLQAAGAVLAGGCVYWSFHKPVAEDLRIAILLPATLLAGPHVSSQDGMLLAAAAILLLRHATGSGLRLADACAIVAVWIAELFDPPAILRLGVVTPVVIALFMATAIIRAREGLRGPMPLPAGAAR